jgi:hypothetical protein
MAHPSAVIRVPDNYSQPISPDSESLWIGTQVPALNLAYAFCQSFKPSDVSVISCSDVGPKSSADRIVVRRFSGITFFPISTSALMDDVENHSQIWAVAPALVKLALRDVQRSQKDKEPPWKRIAKGRRWAM